MADPKVITKIDKSYPISTTGTSTGNSIFINDFNEEWNKIIQDQKKIFPDGNSIWLPQSPSDPWTNYDFGTPVKARCYNRKCENETTLMTELMVGSLHLKTYLCKSCLEDLASKIKNELGIDEEEEK